MSSHFPGRSCGPCKLSVPLHSVNLIKNLHEEPIRYFLNVKTGSRLKSSKMLMFSFHITVLPTFYNKKTKSKELAAVMHKNTRKQIIGSCVEGKNQCC